MEKSGFLLWSKLQGKVRTEDTGNGSRFVSRQVPILNPIMEGRLSMCNIKQASTNNMNFRFKKRSLTGLKQTQRYMSGFFARNIGTKARHIPLHLLQQGQARFMCRDPDYC